MLIRRTISALMLIPPVVLAAYLGGWYLFVAVLLAGLLAGREYLLLLRRLNLNPSIPLTLIFFLCAMADGQWPELGILGWAAWPAAALMLAEQVFRRNRPGSLYSWACSYAGVIYIGLSLGFFVRLRALDQGLAWIALALIGVWVSDSTAYFVGGAWGRRRLAPFISPKKSWEGLVGGLAAGMLVVWLIGWLALGLPHWQGLVLGVVVVAAATLGDLAESVIKRQVSVKDSGNLIPGHGGMLDRVDSLLFVGPAVYYIAMLFALL